MGLCHVLMPSQADNLLEGARMCLAFTLSQRLEGKQAAQPPQGSLGKHVMVDLAVIS